jgi:ATP-dependent Clp protease adaptor protein ClpS
MIPGMDPTTATLPAPRTTPRVKQPRLWHVVLLDDDHHSYEYVIDMAQRLFGATPERAYQLAKTVDAEGRAVCMTTHRELGELKVEQVHAFGVDPRIASCAGAMSAVLEPAESGGEGE